MRALILLIITINHAWALNCKGFKDAEMLLNTKKFLQISKEHLIRNEERKKMHLPPEHEYTLKLHDINQAKSFAMNFPAIRELGFPGVSKYDWRPHTKRLGTGAGLKDGWEIHHHGRYARVRIDWDDKIGMHYNIEIEDQQRNLHKLAVAFECQKGPCTKEDFNRLIQHQQ